VPNDSIRPNGVHNRTAERLIVEWPPHALLNVNKCQIVQSLRFVVATSNVTNAGIKNEGIQVVEGLRRWIVRSWELRRNSMSKRRKRKDAFIFFDGSDDLRHDNPTSFNFSSCHCQIFSFTTLHKFFVGLKSGPCRGHVKKKKCKISRF
jgi:hypothetical protein